MSLVKIIAIEPFDGHQPGAEVERPESQARALVKRGLAKMAVPVANKMAAPVANKANPSPAAGEEQQSSASQAAQASPRTTAQPSVRGSAPAKRGPGRPRGGSSR